MAAGREGAMMGCGLAAKSSIIAVTAKMTNLMPRGSQAVTAVSSFATAAIAQRMPRGDNSATCVSSSNSGRMWNGRSHSHSLSHSRGYDMVSLPLGSSNDVSHVAGARSTTQTVASRSLNVADSGLLVLRVCSPHTTVCSPHTAAHGLHMYNAAFPHSKATSKKKKKMVYVKASFSPPPPPPPPPPPSSSSSSSPSPSNGGSGTAMTVSDVMTGSGIVSVKATTAVDNALQAIVDHRISGLPVVDDDYRLVGVVSDYDLLALNPAAMSGAHRESSIPDDRSIFSLSPGNARWKKLWQKMEGKTVGDVMTPSPLAVRSTANLEDAVRLLLECKYKRLPVVDDNGKLVGILSRADVVKLALLIRADAEAGPGAKPSPPS